MSNTSATGGYLSPAVASPPLEDAALDAIFQTAIAGITGLAGNLVRPRWQPNPPRHPERDVDWCALGIESIEPDAGPAIVHAPTGEGTDSYVRHEEIVVFVTFYGPNGGRYAATLRDGLAIPQNLEALKANGVGFVDTSGVRSVPELVNQQWLRRYDITARFRRKVSRTYGVLNVLSADPILVNDELGILSN